MNKFKEAEHYKKLPEKRVRCTLCPHDCVIGNGERGKCKVRMNILGSLKAMNHGKPHTVQEGKSEDLGFFHYLPNASVLRIGNAGENLEGDLYKTEHTGKEIEDIPTVNQSPTKIMEQVDKNDIKIIGYSYSEPGLAFEFIKDISEIKGKVKQAIVTNGFLEELPARELAKKIDAAVVEIRSMNESFYENILKAKLEPILKTTKILHDNNVWVEIKIKLFPGVHDDLYDIKKLVSWILNNLDANVPLHLIASQGVNPEILVKARKTSMEAGMNYVYTHGIGFPTGLATWCPGCKKPTISRLEEGRFNTINNGKCKCGKEIAGIWE